MNKYQWALHRLWSAINRNEYLIYDKQLMEELVEKATPKKPKLIKDSFEDYEKCSICGMIVNYGANHCEHCGQALDWSESEEE